MKSGKPRKKNRSASDNFKVSPENTKTPENPGSLYLYLWVSKKLTERDAILAVMFPDRHRTSLCVPNYTPQGWWECDLFEITKSGMMVEWEVKLSKSDFLADRHKHRLIQRRMGKLMEQASMVKHLQLALGHPGGPSRFVYVTPEGLIPSEWIPRWAGWYEIVPGLGKFWRVVEKKAAPQLHRNRVSDEIQKHAHGVCYNRYHNLIRGS